MFSIAATMMLALSGAQPASAPTVGACAWNGAPASIRTSYLSAYKAGMNESGAVLATSDSDLEASFEHCAGRKDVPKLWVQGAVGSNAIQNGASAALLETKQLSRDDLDNAWIEAPKAARACTRANAQKIFGLTQASCSDPKAPLWFLQRFGISPQSDRPVASQILIYYNAKAQDEWAETLIAKFREKPST